MPIHSAHQKELLAQIGWVRSLAIQLVRDPDVAEDLTQDAMLVALTSPVENPVSVRSWFAAILRNLSRTHGRSERRRSEREDLLRVPDRQPSTLQVVERAGAYQEIVAELMQLAEPYRSTLLYRFFDGLSQREVAEQMALTESTVSTRTREGIRRLRLRLKPSDAPDDSAWLFGFFGLRPSALRGPKEWPSLPSFAGVIALSLPVKLILVAIGIAAVVIGVNGLGSPELVEPELFPTRATSELAKLQGLVEHHSVRVEVSREEQVAEPSVLDPHAGIHDFVERYKPKMQDIQGRVIDLQGTPVAGVQVEYMSFDWQPIEVGSVPPGPTKRQVTTDYAGAFSLTDGAPLNFNVETDLLTTVYSGVVSWDAPAPHPLVIVAPRMRVAGLVLDEAGQSVPGATVSIDFDVGEQLPSGLVLDGSQLVAKKTKTDEQGSFEFISGAELGDLSVRAIALGFALTIVPVPPGGGLGIRVELSRLKANAHTIFGYVQLPDGRPSENTMVSAGSVSTRTDAAGWFALDFGMALGWMDRKAPLQLAAARAGYSPATAQYISIDEAESLGWPNGIILVLGGESLSIHGRVVDQDGEPLVGIRVGSRDMTQFGLEMEPGAGWGFMRTLEEVSSGANSTKSGFNGEFRFEGLLDREYRLRLIEEDSLLTSESVPVKAGSRDITLVLDRQKLGTLAGMITDRNGSGLADIRVAVTMRSTGALEIGRSATTDSSGRFRLVSVNVDPEFLRIEGREIVPELFRELPKEADPLELVLPVSRLCRFQVDWADWAGRASHLLLLDETGEPTEMIDRTGGKIGIRPRLLVREGRSPIVAISDTATHATLMVGDQELERFEVYPEPGETILLQLP